MGWIPWKYWNIVELPGKAGMSLDDWNVWNVSGRSGTTENVIGATGVAWKHTDAFLEDLLAFYA